jgi:hypothetical protein
MACKDAVKEKINQKIEADLNRPPLSSPGTCYELEIQVVANKRVTWILVGPN